MEKNFRIVVLSIMVKISGFVCVIGVITRTRSGNSVYICRSVFRKLRDTYFSDRSEFEYLGQFCPIVSFSDDCKRAMDFFYNNRRLNLAASYMVSFLPKSCFIRVK